MANGGGPGHGHTQPTQKKAAGASGTRTEKAKKAVPGHRTKTKSGPKARPKNGD